MRKHATIGKLFGSGVCCDVNAEATYVVRAIGEC
jgi:hypothetical protein